MTRQAVPEGVHVTLVRPRLSWGAVLTGMFATMFGLFGSAGLVMVMLGVCHSDVNNGVPALGYIPTLEALVALKLIFNAALPWDHYKVWTRAANR